MIEGRPKSPQDSDEDIQKPDYLDRSFWNEETHEVRLPELVKAFKDSQTLLRHKQEEMRAEIEAELKAGRPETAEGYEVGELNLDIPEGVEFSIPEDDPTVAEFRTWAHDAGLTKEQFQKGIGIYAKSRLAGIPNIEEERKALGENADSRIQALTRAASRVLNDDQWKIFQRMSTTAAQFEVLEKLGLRRQIGPAQFETPAPSTADLKIELDKIMSSPEYRRGDQAYNQKALDLAQRLGRIRRSQER